MPTKVQTALSIKRPCRRKRLRVEPDAQKHDASQSTVMLCGCKFYQLQWHSNIVHALKLEELVPVAVPPEAWTDFME